MIIEISLIAVLGVVGFLFGLILAFANKKLAIEMNPLIHEVEDILPKGQCGACGYAGCQAYAEAVVLNADVSPSLCTPGKSAVAELVAKLTGKASEKIEPRVAHIRCANPISVAIKKYRYAGLQNCVAASLLHFGPKDCQYGCIGFGTCEKACPFNAIKMNSEGLPVVDHATCTGCGKCATVCPKHIIQMVSINAHVGVDCSSLDKGAVARKLCKVACIGCGICAKSCPYSAIEIKDFLAQVNHQLCMTQCSDRVCLAKCPTHAIRARISN